MYQMLSTITLVFLYIVLKIIKNKGNNTYFFYIALGCMGLCVLAYLVINKRFKDLLWAYLACAGAILLNIFVIFNSTIERFAFSHGASYLEKLKSFSLNVDFIKEYIKQSYRGGTIFVLILIALIVLALMVIVKKK